MYLKNDRYRITVAIGGGKFNYNYFGEGNSAGNAGRSIPLSQRTKGFLIEPKIRFFRDWYLGPRYHVISNDVSLNDPALDPTHLPVPLPGDLQVRTAALGIRVLRDSSDSPYYPRKGSLFDTLVDFFGPGVGGQRNYQNVKISYSKYQSFGPKSVLAFRGSMCVATEEAPFYDVCMLGVAKDLRGYQIGQYRDDRMLVGQAEFRRELFWRVGAVAFAGAGAVAHDWGDFGNSDAQPGAGAGLRLLLAKKNHINLRIDYAWGHGSTATYVGIGEAF
jgi:outer membrane protein assembly factor BamA